MLKRNEVFLFSCLECNTYFWVTEDMCYPYITKDKKHVLNRCPACGYERWLFEICRGDQCDWDLGEEVEEPEYLFYCSRCDNGFTVKASECGEDYLHNITHECPRCHSVVRALGLPNRFKERD